jgi:hypothetical protein
MVRGCEGLTGPHLNVIVSQKNYYKERAISFLFVKTVIDVFLCLLQYNRICCIFSLLSIYDLINREAKLET